MCLRKNSQQASGRSLCYTTPPVTKLSLIIFGLSGAVEMQIAHITRHIFTEIHLLLFFSEAK